jgi:hypothetical protein
MSSWGFALILIHRQDVKRGLSIAMILAWSYTINDIFEGSKTHVGSLYMW